MLIRAFSDKKWLAMVMAGDSRVSPVSFLKAQPSMAIFLPVMLDSQHQMAPSSL